jgi:glycosyltransferase involved in cell wall biosynthesis
MNTPSVSIVIASHRPEMIGRCIDSLTPSVCGDVPVEIVVVADYPVETFVPHYGRVRWLYLNNRSISAKRNFGVEQATGGVIGFIDDDCRAMENWIPAALAFLRENPAVDAVEGYTMIEKSGGDSGAIREYRRLEKPGYRTNNIFYKRKIFSECGGFDERFTVQREDLDLAFTVIEGRHLIGHSGDIRVEHAFRHRDHWDLLKNCINRRFDPLLYRKHRTLYRKHIGSPFPPALLTLGVIHAAALLSIPFPVSPFIGIIDIGAVTFLSVRRTGVSRSAVRRFPEEWISMAAAPFVLAGALLYGSMRWKRFLIW